VKVDRHSKTKKSTFVNFEIFRMKEKDIPIELLELKENIHAFSWEPRGDRFAIIHGENANRPDVSFYSLVEQQLKKLKTLEKRLANCLFWSPAGSFIILAGLRNLNGVLEFFNVDDMESMINEEHSMCTAVDWDPSGRYVSTTVSHWRHSLDTGYNIFTFAGKLVYKVVKDKFFQLTWRPRPHTLLSTDKIEQIKRELPRYSKVYLKEEKARAKGHEAIIKKERAALRQEFNKLVAEREKEYAAWRHTLNEIYGRNLDAEEKEVQDVKEEVEELVDYQEEVVDDVV